ncbi:MAG: prepilin-type N-terminal cleavage/methylation domain-containing protein [Alphaproteobacteria bacterium]|nr:MAG: prepilin-type N-terminal cleavage/methylation domain-containing protein [Alphaproteobacteria bacterium]
MLDSRKLKAFSLIELSISLLIIGIILGSVFKGMQLVENAKLQAVAKQFQEIRLDVEQYIARYGEFPSTPDDTTGALNKMHSKGILKSNQPIKSKFGGEFKFKDVGGKYCIQLVSTTGQALLNSKQTEYLKSLIEDNIMDGDIISCAISNY